jgi:glycerol kinase
VEHRPADIWASVEKGIRATQRKKICKPADIAAIGITNQRETAMLWDRQTGQPLNNAIVWQCRRTTDFCAQLKAAGREAQYRPGAGPLFFGQQVPLAAVANHRDRPQTEGQPCGGGYHRQLPGLAADEGR